MDANVTTRPDPSDTQTTVVEVDGKIAGGFTLVSTRPTAFAAHFIYTQEHVHGFWSDGIRYADAESAIQAIVDQYVA